MMQEMEDFFAARFGVYFSPLSRPFLTMVLVRGNKKKARIRLRAGERHKSHHLSMFCSGIMLGLAVPALTSGIYWSAFLFYVAFYLLAALMLLISILLRLSAADSTSYSWMGRTTACVWHFSGPSCFGLVGGSEFGGLVEVEGQLRLYLWYVD
jgi:hypothetical protein